MKQLMPVQVTVYMDASHAPKKKNCRTTHTFSLIFAQRSLTIGLVQLNMCHLVQSLSCCACIAVGFKLQMFGVPIKDATWILTDNESMFKNSS